MKFTPKSKKEIAEMGLIPPGQYPFEVMKAEETVSSNGDDMIKVMLKIFTPGGERVVFDNLSNAFMVHKFVHFCSAIGRSRAYEAGELMAEDLIGRCGECEISIKKDKTGTYPDRNNVKDYIKQESEDSNGSTKLPPPVLLENDDMPF